jgi:hypothetical protein
MVPYMKKKDAKIACLMVEKVQGVVCILSGLREKKALIF